MIEIRTSDAPVEMVDLFSIDDVVYQVPAKPQVHLALQFFDDAAETSYLEAQMKLMKNLIGEKAWLALTECKDLTQDQMKAISDELLDRTLGGVENETGNGESGPSKSDG